MRRRTILSAVGTAAMGAAALERHHLRQIDRDPEQALLRSPPAGRALGIRSVDGTRLHAEAFGAEGETTVVLAHGWTESLAYWVYVIDELIRHGIRVLAYDLRGHGQSEQAAGGDYAMRRFGEDVEAVLGAAVESGGRAIVAGHSLGAMSIAAWAEHHDVEARASAAALLNTGVGDLLAEHLLVPVPWVASALNRVLPPASFLGSRAPVPRYSTPMSSALVHYAAFGPAATPAQVAFYERMLVACPPDVRANVGIALSEMELSDALARLTVPTLVLAGAQDRLTPPSHARRIAQALPELHRLVILEDTGHMAPLERHGEVSDALLDLVRVATDAPTAVA